MLYHGTSDATPLQMPFFIQSCALMATCHHYLDQLVVGTVFKEPVYQPTVCVCVCVFQSHMLRAVRCWGQPTTENSLSPDREESATVHAASVLPHHLSETIYHDTSEAMTLVVNNSLAIRRHFCLHGHIRQRRLWERLFKRCFINGLTYLLPDTTSNSATHHSATVHIEAQWLGSAEACR